MLRYERILDLAEIHCDLGTDSRGRKSFEFDNHGVVAFARAVEAAAYEAAIRAIEATRIDPEDVIEEVDRETNRTIDWCVEVVRSMLPKEQPE